MQADHAIRRTTNKNLQGNPEAGEETISLFLFKKTQPGWRAVDSSPVEPLVQEVHEIADATFQSSNQQGIVEYAWDQLEPRPGPRGRGTCVEMSRLPLTVNPRQTCAHV